MKKTTSEMIKDGMSKEEIIEQVMVGDYNDSCKGFANDPNKLKQTVFPDINLDVTIEDTVMSNIMAKQTACKHWDYLKGIFETHGFSEKLIDVIDFHYKTAFVHGWKHGVEYAKKGE